MCHNNDGCQSDRYPNVQNGKMKRKQHLRHGLRADGDYSFPEIDRWMVVL